jgi:hypothetical protein
MTASPAAPIIDPAWKDFATDRQKLYVDTVNRLGSRRAAARALGVNKNAISESLGRLERVAEAQAKRTAPAPSRLTFVPDAPVPVSEPKPVEPVARNPRATRYLCTAAQDDTPVHQGFWANLQAYARHLGAEVVVGGFTYQLGTFTDHSTANAVFDEAVRPWLFLDNIDRGPFVFCGRVNTLPTARRPLMGAETYTRGKWGVFPHAKIQFASVPSLPGKHPAMQMTTGVVTHPNYIPKRAGVIAEFHHQIGATLVEVDSEDRVFCRQICAEPDGSFQDLDIKVANGEVTRGHRVEAITWGDVHWEKLDPIVAKACWGLDVETGQIARSDNMLDVLRPGHQAFHDLLDFEARNHHRRADHVHAYKMRNRERDAIEFANAGCASFLRQTQRPGCVSVVVASNHNDAMSRWLRETDPRTDAVNARFWCEATQAILDAVDRGEEHFDPFPWALARHDARQLRDIVFVPRNGSYVVCHGVGGIELGLHGDEGPNGARGSANGLTRVATRMNIGHSHSAAILDGVYQAGVCGMLDQGYNSGPSSWSHTQVVVYPNGRRTLVTVQDGKWRA